MVKLGANGIGYLLQPDYYCIVDPRAYALFRDVFDRASAVRLLASWLPVAPCDYVIPLARHRESGFDRGVFYHGRNVGYVLLQLAYFLGASEIHLIGIDGYSPARANYFQRFPQWYADRSAALWTQRFAELTTSCFAAAAAALNAEGIEIINHSPASFLRTLPGVSTRAAR